jgi:hypothetical protein
VGSSGDATLDVLLGGERGQALLGRVPGAIASPAFPTASTVDVVIEENDDGWAFGVVRARGIYVPGPAPSFGFETGPALTVLREAGYATVEVTACVPGVPRTFEVVPTGEQITESCVRWNVVEGEAPPRLHIEMRPEPSRGWVIVSLYVVVIAAGIAGWFTRRNFRCGQQSARGGSIVMGLASLIAFVAMAAMPSRYGVDNLAVSGAVSPGAFGVASVSLGIAAFFALGLGLYVLVAGVANDPRRLLQQRRS